MSDVITTLHPENDPNTNLYPNVKRENLPDLPKEVLVDGIYSTTTTLAYVGCSFTLTKRKLVKAVYYWFSGQPTAIAICNSDTSPNPDMKAYMSKPDGLNPTTIECEALLDSGTYYIYARSTGPGSNRIAILEYEIH